MNLYQILNTKTGNRKAAEVKYLAGKAEGFPTEESVYAAAKADPRLEFNRGAGAVRINPDYKPEPKTKSKPTTKVGKVTDVPKTSEGSNKHLWALLNDRDLNTYEQAMAHRLHAYYFSSKKPVEIASATLGKECGMSDRKAKDTAAALVAAG